MTNAYFSFKSGKPVAQIIGGKYDGKILFIKEDPTKEGPQAFELSDRGIFSQIPAKLDRILYIAGPSGSGKSTYAAHYIENYKKLHPKADFYVFSRLDHDPAIEHLKPKRIMIDESLIDDPIEINKEIKKHSIILFDDIDTIQNSKLQLAINKIKADLLEIGRHRDLRVVTTSHLINPNDRKAARTLLNEMNTLTIFPQAGSTYQIEYALKQYFGLSGKQIKYIMNLPSRWVTIFKNYPQIILYDKGARFIKDL